MFQRRSTKRKPVPWSTKDESKFLKLLEEEKCGIATLRSIFPERSDASLRAKRRKLKIRENIFGERYRAVKSEFTAEIAARIRPRMIFEAYAGIGHQTRVWLDHCDHLVCAELNPAKCKILVKNLISDGYKKCNGFNHHWVSLKNHNKTVDVFQGDALRAATEIAVFVGGADVLDLDTCGSTIPTITTFVNLLHPKHMLITHGEFHSLRFGREDVLKRLMCHKSIAQEILPLTVNGLALELDRAVKVSCLRAHNETKDSYFPELVGECWLGEPQSGMLRRYYKIEKAIATADSINRIVSDKDKCQ